MPRRAVRDPGTQQRDSATAPSPLLPRSRPARGEQCAVPVVRLLGPACGVCLAGDAAGVRPRPEGARWLERLGAERRCESALDRRCRTGHRSWAPQGAIRPYGFGLRKAAGSIPAVTRAGWRGLPPVPAPTTDGDAAWTRSPSSHHTTYRNTPLDLYESAMISGGPARPHRPPGASGDLSSRAAVRSRRRRRVRCAAMNGALSTGRHTPGTLPESGATDGPSPNGPSVSRRLNLRTGSRKSPFLANRLARPGALAEASESRAC